MNENNSEKSFRSEEPPPDEEDFNLREEEIKNRQLMEELKQKHLEHRQWVKKLELDQQVKNELEREQRLRELAARKSYIERRNRSAKFRAMVNNEKIEKMLNQIDNYIRRIKNLDNIDKIKKQAQKEYEEEIKKNKKLAKFTDESVKRLSQLNKKNQELREINKEFRKKKDEEDKMKKEKILKANILNEKINNILQNGFGNFTKENKEEKKTMFTFEEVGEGTNSANPGLNVIPEEKRPKSSLLNKRKKEENTYFFPLINENSNMNAEQELQKLLKEDKNNLKKLLAFKKKYPDFDISTYLHNAQINNLKKKKTVVTNKIVNSNPKNIELNTNEQKYYSTYLKSCKYNNNDYIQAHLLNAKDDIEIFEMINEKDEYNRNGLMYLLIHNNLPMIKLSLSSGVILSNCLDIYGRNIIHYACILSSTDLFDNICHCQNFEYKEDFEGMNKYIKKCIKISRNDKNLSIEECESNIKEFDDLIENKENTIKPEEVLRKREEENEMKNNRNIKINGEYSKTNYEGNRGIKKSTLVENGTNIYNKELKKNKISTRILVNSSDIDGNYPIHICSKENDFEKIKILLYYNARLDVLDTQGKKAIDLTTSEEIQQFLLRSEENSEKKKVNKNIKNTQNISFNQSNVSLNNLSHLDMNKIKFYSEEKINSFTTGYENNNYLILSVLLNDFDMFRYLLTEKNIKADFRNSNGFSAIHYILLQKNYAFFGFLFDLPNDCESPEKILNNLQNKKYTKQNIYKSNGELTYTGQSIKIIDSLGNNNSNALSICIDALNNLDMFKSILEIYNVQKEYFPDSSPIDIVLNRQYGKNKQPLLISVIEKRNYEMLSYFLKDIKKISKIDYYNTDVNKKNALHHAVINKDKKAIQTLIKFDSEKNLLREMEDSKGKIPEKYDNAKNFIYEMTTIFDACKSNDLDMTEKLINELKYYSINEQTPITKNSALHIAAKNKSDKVCLFLVKNNCDTNILNKKKKTALEVIIEDLTISRHWVEKFKKIINGKIIEYNDLDKSDTLSKIDKSIDSGISEKKIIIKDKKVQEIVRKIKDEFKKRKTNIRKIFEKLDENKNGVLEGREFEMLFTCLNIPRVSREDILLVNAYIDRNKNGLIEYEEFLGLLGENKEDKNEKEEDKNEKEEDKSKEEDKKSK